MKKRWIAAFATLIIIAACGDSSTNGSSTQDSTITTSPDNTTVNPGAGQDTSRNGMRDSSMNRMDSGNMNKR